MLILLFIPVIAWFTFKNLIASGFPDFETHSSVSRNFLEWALLVLAGSVITALISIAPIVLYCWIGSIPKTIGKFDRDYPLIALREKSGTSGQFFLGSGVISDRQYYFWYRLNPDGSVSGGKTNRNPGVHIYERDGAPFMRTYKDSYANPYVEKWIWLIGNPALDSTYDPNFYIPKGSIQEGFSL